MIVTIHQPEFMPYLGFFHKMNMADTFVLLDNVQFKKNNYQNRNKLLINGKANWLTIPLKKSKLNTNINKIEVDLTQRNFIKKQLKLIEQNYSKHTYFNDLFPDIKKIYEKKHSLLSHFNIDIILLLRKKLEINTTILKASDLSLSGTARGGTEVTLEISKLLKADTYISGAGGKNYMDISLFKKENINVYFQNYNHPAYEQLKTEITVPYLSVIDLYFNHGNKSLDILMKNNDSQVS